MAYDSMLDSSDARELRSVLSDLILDGNKSHRISCQMGIKICLPKADING